ncbi:hypothetical protein C0992_003898 [Termitomyces sp. T32_za158]|nr:hypothetical protein C0992_003898 [Termitomyces sp. T32_za158]
MVENVEAQQKAQDEIDAVIGTNRLPDFSDRPNLPYVEALFREVMRWHPVLPLGVSHAASEDDIYEGYFIPKGLLDSLHCTDLSFDFRDNCYIKYMVCGAMTHDETQYPQPDLFLPERFFDENGRLNNDDAVLAFGFGRR